MNAVAKVEAADPLALLREPFPANQISKLPKETKKQTEDRKADMARGQWPAKCEICDNFHHPKATHLDYVGHAALTDRLLDVDPHWSWEPMGFASDGLPAFDQSGGLWIKLTVCGITRPGYGCADGKRGGDAIKEIIGDALRNAAMRFGAALDLWHKGDLHVSDEEASDGGSTEDNSGERTASPGGPVTDTEKGKRVKLDGPYTSKTALWSAFKAFDRELRGCGDSDEFECLLTTDDAKALVAQCERDAPQLLSGGDDLPAEFLPLNDLITQRRKDFADLDTANQMAGYART